MELAALSKDMRFLSHLKSALELSPICVMVAEAPDGKIIYANKAVEKFRGHTESPLLDINIDSYFRSWRAFTTHGKQLYGEDMPIGRAILHGETVENDEMRFELDDGSQKWALVSAVPVKDEHANVVAAVAIWYDITAQKKLEADLQRKASFDFLTGAYSRQKITELAERSLARAVIDQSCVSFLLIDLDHFKLVNDQHGHLIGDDVLVKFVHLMLRSLRPGDLFGRYGGEEFLAVVTTPQDGEGFNIAEKLRSKVEQTPIETEAGNIELTCSIGVLTLDTKKRAFTFHEVMAKIDKALYQAKTQGRNRVYEAEPN